jgi:thiamine biosynthesis protein ThiS
MWICLNGEKKEVPDGVTLGGMISSFKMKKDSIVIELNRKVMKQSELHNCPLSENDVVEVVQFVGGG